MNSSAVQQIRNRSRAGDWLIYPANLNEVWTAQARPAREEGIFCEPAAATALAGVLRAAEQRELATDATVVCLITGSALKDLASLDRMIASQACPTIEIDRFSEWLTR